MHVEGEQKKCTDVFKSGGNILGQSASKCLNKLFIIKFSHFRDKILPPDLKTSVHSFFAQPLIKTQRFLLP